MLKKMMRKNSFFKGFPLQEKISATQKTVGKVMFFEIQRTVKRANTQQTYQIGTIHIR